MLYCIFQIEDHSLKLSDIFRWIFSNIESIYYIVGIFGIVTIIIAVCNYHNSVKHEKFDTSMRVIKTFQYKILSKLIKGHQQYFHNKRLERYIFTNYYYRIYSR